VETVGADSLAQAMAARAPAELAAITSIATSLGARQVAPQALADALAHPVTSMLVSDQAAVDACLRFVDDQRVLVEPACGAALAALYGDAAQLAAYRNVLVIVCGGVTATLAQLQSWAARAAH
jgi:L-serine/L-threonine ammonia-lyase